MLDRGSQSQGVQFKLAPQNLEAELGKLVWREIIVKPPKNLPCWISVQTEHGPLWALVFVMNRQSRSYVGKLSAEEVADVQARACGHWGSGEERLCITFMRLEEHGVHDRGLGPLQELCRYSAPIGLFPSHFSKRTHGAQSSTGLFG